MSPLIHASPRRAPFGKGAACVALAKPFCKPFSPGASRIVFDRAWDGAVTGKDSVRIPAMISINQFPTLFLNSA
jgi:hypothetical protein